jgi:hypothetical protein
MGTYSVHATKRIGAETADTFFDLLLRLGQEATGDG